MSDSERDIFFKKLIGLLEESDGKLLVDEVIFSLGTLAYQLAVQHAPTPEEGVEIFCEIMDSITESGNEDDFPEDTEVELK
jgi:hypothetical protein